MIKLYVEGRHSCWAMSSSGNGLQSGNDHFESKRSNFNVWRFLVPGWIIFQIVISFTGDQNRCCSPQFSLRFSRYNSLVLTLQLQIFAKTFIASLFKTFDGSSKPRIFLSSTSFWCNSHAIARLALIKVAKRIRDWTAGNSSQPLPNKYFSDLLGN